ncbi:hypothetical protein CARUB_v10016309mg [Capsella rubella]|uniref:GRF-type domain-containing protein n=1 Tax=Capsella rubella TaxID=81985 RepID=R0HT63_9BRAS|nr:uncharacterized protein At4g04775 [Capsella rubella]EOA32979.1 hypothetical protein CARUB_v10016309mg [Capsella rubella]
MSQFSSSESSQLTSNATHRGVPSRCWCGHKITTYTSTTDENPYRRFYRCVQGVKKQKEKHLFCWVDEAHLEEIRMVDKKHNKLVEDVNNIRKMMMENVEVQKKMVEDMNTKMNEKLNEIIEQELMVAKNGVEKSSMKTLLLVTVVASIAWLCGKVF